MSTAIEQLRAAFHLALRAQQTSEFDAAALVRTWPTLANAAAVAHRSLGTGTHRLDLLVERIALDAESIGAPVERQQWPGFGKTDHALAQVAAALQKSTTVSAAVRPEDLAEANRLIVSTLWTTSQLVGRAARDHSVDLHMDPRDSPPSQPELTSILRDVYRRFSAVEQLAAGALANPGARPGGPSNAGTELRRAVAVWDVEAHRALLGDKSTAVLHVLSHLQAESVKAFEGFVAQATESDVIDKVTAGRLTPILQDSSTTWERLRDASAELSFGSIPVPMSLITAGRQLSERFSDAIHHSGPEDHAEILHALSGHLSSCVTISASACDLIETGELRAPARAINRMMIEQYPDRLAAPVDAVAIHRRQTLPLPPETRGVLADPARRAFLNADEALNRAAGLDALYRSPASARHALRAGTRKVPAVQAHPVLNAPRRSGNPAP